MKKLIFGFIIFFLPLLVAHANSISNIDMSIYLDQNGDALINETWTANVSSGTEGYHPYFNIGNSSINLIEASMDGQKYTITNNWDINSSLNSKANKAGIYHSDNEVDICFGLTSYGRHTYKIVYKITNFVLALDDADMVYWTLFPHDFSASPDKVHIKIYSDFKYEDTLDVWGYGNYGGTSYVYDGYIEMSKNNLSSSEYMTILVKFPKGTFNTTNISNETFDYYYNMAEEGSTEYNFNYSSNGYLGNIFYIFQSLIYIFGTFFFIIFISKLSLGYNKIYKFGRAGKKLKNVQTFRDIPCNKDIYRAFFVAQKYNLSSKKTDFLGAILLKWIKNGNIEVEKVEKKKLTKTETINNIIFKNRPIDIELETTMYDWMLEASLDGKLESDEFNRWCKKNYSKVLKWFDKVINYESDILIKEGKIDVQVKGKGLFSITHYVIDDSMMEEALQLAGLKKFLKEFTLINERTPIEVNLWDEYLMYAQIFGIASKVAKQFKELYPEINEMMETNGFYYDNIDFIFIMSARGMSEADKAMSYNSGGGGFSSGGGGGGSFGGGGGGGGFR